MSTGDFLWRLRNINVVRCVDGYKQPLNDWSLMEWGCALGGEAGELLNKLKKLQREQQGYGGAGCRKLDNPNKAIADEMADIIIYMDLIAAQLNINLEDAVIEKFNTDSKAIGFKEELE